MLKSDMQVVQRSVCQRDGRWFLKLLQAETDRMEGWCRQMELDQQENALPEDSMFVCVYACVGVCEKERARERDEREGERPYTFYSGKSYNNMKDFS